MKQDHTLSGVTLMIVFCVIAPLLDVASKLAAETIPVGQITAFRFLLQGALMLPVVLIMRLHWGVTPREAVLLTIRAIFLILSTYCFVAAIQYMPLADALAIVFVDPFILLILGHLIFKDEVGPRRLTACLVGFGGAILVIQPSLAVFGAIALFPLGTAIFFAIYMLITRALSTGIHPVMMQMHTSIAGSVICLPLLFLFDGSGILSLDPVMPQGWAWVWLLGVGFWGAASHICMTYALKFASPTTLAPLHYLEIVSAVVLGYLVFGDFPNGMTWAGIGVIVASGLYIIIRERKVARQRRAAAATAAPVH